MKMRCHLFVSIILEWRRQIRQIRCLKYIWFGFCLETILKLGSGCSTVGRLVASNTRDLRFESSHQQFYQENKENEVQDGEVIFLKKLGLHQPFFSQW